MTGIEFLNDYQENRENYYPMVDKIGTLFEKETTLGDINLGWNSGTIENNRPFFIECWVGEGLTVLTVFISKIDLEGYSEKEIDQLLIDNNIYHRKPNAPFPGIAELFDANGNEFYSINQIVGNENETYVDFDCGFFSIESFNEYSIAFKKKREDELLNRAISFAVDSHKGDYRKGTNIPYIVHPIEALEIVSRMTDDIYVRVATVLHDTVEDTNATAKVIRETFGDKTAYLVAKVTENKREEYSPKVTWTVRKQESIDALMAEEDEKVLMIVLADKLSNMRAIKKDYLVLGDNLWDRFNVKNKSQHAWYYKSIINALQSLEKFPEYQEYVEIVHDVFGD